MTVALSCSPATGKARASTVTVTVTGLANSTAYYATLGVEDAAVKTIPFVSNSSGTGTFTFVPQGSGTDTINVYLSNTSPTTLGSVTFVSGS